MQFRFLLGGFLVDRRVLQQAMAEPGRQYQGDRQGNEHAGAGIDRDRAHVRAHQPGHEGHRQQRGDDGKGCKDRGAADLIDGRRDDLTNRAGAEATVPVYVLDDDDGVVHEYSDREDQGEQRHPIDRESPRPGSEQRRGQRHYDGCAHDDGLAPAQREPGQQDDRHGCKRQLLDEFRRLVVRRLAVVARNRDVHALGDQRCFELRQPFHHGVRDVGRVRARFFCNGDRYSRCIRNGIDAYLICGRSGRKPRVRVGLIGMGAYRRNVIEIDGAAFEHPDHEPGDVFPVAEKCAGLHGHFGIVVHERAGVGDCIAGRKGLAQVVEGHAEAGHALRVQLYVDDLPRAADGVYVPGARDALDFRLQRVRDLE